MKTAYSNRRKNSGQVLIITSLVVVMLLLSTVIYVTETEKNAPVYNADGNVGLSTIRQAARHTIMSALVNISNGGAPSVLAEDLNRLSSAVGSRSYNAMSDLKVAALNSAPYADGVWVSWGANGEGVSSILVNFALNASGNSGSYYSDYTINVTSSISINGYFTQLNESERQVNLISTVLNEGKHAQAGNSVFFYEQDSPVGWMQAASPSTIDYGNGTYLTTFTAENTTQSTLPVSVHYQDTRGISVWTNATCIQG